MRNFSLRRDASPRRVRRDATVISAFLATSLFVGSMAAGAAAEVDTVGKALEELTKIEDEATKISRDLDAARADQAKAERKLRTAESDIAEQEQLVGQMRTVVARVAIAQQQQGAGLSVAGFLFSSPDDASFLRDMATAQSVAAITSEQMTRLNAEVARLADLKRTQSEAITNLDSQIKRNTELQAEYEVRVKQARATVDRLSAAEIRQIEQIKDAQARADATKQLTSALSSASVSREGRPAELMGSEKAVRPTDGPITSPFGPRTNPIGGYGEFHNGIDIAPPCGTPVRATWTGVVLSAGYDGGWGNRIIVDSGATRALYAHLNTMAVSPGELVQAGQVIGSVGTTGYSTGCHLHFTTWVGESLVDPASLF